MLDATDRRILAALLHALPVLELAAGHDVARVGKRRHPASVGEAGIPADMVHVEMRADDVVDLLGRYTERGETPDPAAALLVEQPGAGYGG